MKESNLSPPVLAKNKGTVVFRLVPLQGEVSGSVLVFMPILHRSVYILKFLHFARASIAEAYSISCLYCISAPYPAMRSYIP